jgi:hypothetical protein
MDEPLDTGGGGRLEQIASSQDIDLPVGVFTVRCFTVGGCEVVDRADSLDGPGHSIWISDIAHAHIYAGRQTLGPYGRAHQYPDLLAVLCQRTDQVSAGETGRSRH